MKERVKSFIRVLIVRHIDRYLSQNTLRYISEIVSLNHNKVLEMNVLYFAGIIIFPTPLFDIIKDPFLDGPAGYFFCYLLESTYVVFFLSKASILIVTLLALERWFSVVKPFTYKVFFTRKKMFKYVAFVLVLSALVQIHVFFEIQFKNNTCVHVRSLYGKAGKQAFVLSYVIVTFVIPTSITWASFAHIWYRIKRSPSLIGRTDQAQAQEKLLLRMCAITAAVLTCCWLPSQSLYVLDNFDIVISFKVHKIILMLSMSNSFVNPWIYFLSNKEYRNEFFSLFSNCKRNTQLSPETGIQVTNTQIGQVQPTL